MSQTSGQETETREATEAPQVEVANSNVPAESPKKPAKVELDIEDAPFLKEEAPPEPEPEKKEDTPQQEGAEAPKKKSKKKLIIIVLALAIVAVGVIAFLLLSGPPAPPPPEPEAPKPDVIVVPSKPATQTSPDIVKEFERFIIPIGDALPSTKFLICQFSTVTKNPALDSEIDQKILVLRDAVYFYLRGKSYEYLLEPKNAAAIKEDLVGILNDYLGMGKLEDVLLDTYLGQ